MFKKFRHKIDINDNNIDDDALLLSHKKLNIKDLEYSNGISKEIEAASKEELYNLLSHKASQVESLEEKLKECEKNLQQRNEECEKLSASLEQQQGSVLCKLNDLSETYNLDKKHSEAIIANLEESEKELIATVGKLQQENVKLRTRVEDCESEREELQRQRREFYEREDNNEEIYDYLKQELAKVKHMLMNSEKEVKKLQFELNENIACLMKSRERNDELENLLLETSRKAEIIRASLNDATFEKKKLLKKFDETEGLYKMLHAENVELKDKLSFVSTDLRKVRRSLSNVEDTHRSVSDKYEYLRHSSEAVLSKAQSDLEEKESMIVHLECKLEMMDERLEAENLPQNEQIETLINQRMSLEQKLEETHQQLVNIKLTWSETINQLETQVSHLNFKIAEDCEEMSLKDKEITKIRSKLNETETFLTKELTALKERNSHLATENATLMKSIDQLQHKSKEQKLTFETKLKETEDRQQLFQDQAKECESLFISKIGALSTHLRESNAIIKSIENLRSIAS